MTTSADGKPAAGVRLLADSACIVSGIALHDLFDEQCSVSHYVRENALFHMWRATSVESSLNVGDWEQLGDASEFARHAVAEIEWRLFHDGQLGSAVVIAVTKYFVGASQ